MCIGRTRVTRNIAVLFMVLLFSGSCIFSPKPSDDDPVNIDPKWEEPKTPENVLNNLKKAFELDNIEFYRKCLHDNYFYVSKSDIDSLAIRWNKSEDVQIVENIMKGSNKFIFTAQENAQYEEYGENCPNIPMGALQTNKHPNEMWLVINYTVDMEIFTKSYGDINVHQFMEFKFVKKDSLYSIIEWNDLTNQ